MANGMTTDVYHRDNCIAPDIAFIVWTRRIHGAPNILQRGGGGQGEAHLGQCWAADRPWPVATSYQARAALSLGPI